MDELVEELRELVRRWDAVEMADERFHVATGEGQRLYLHEAGRVVGLTTAADQLREVLDEFGLGE